MLLRDDMYLEKQIEGSMEEDEVAGTGVCTFIVTGKKPSVHGVVNY